MARTAIYNEKMTFPKGRRQKPKKALVLSLENDEAMIDIKNRLKKKVQCITEAVSLTTGRVYKIHAEIENVEFESGKGIIISNDDDKLMGYDSSLFVYIYDGMGLDIQPKEIIEPQPLTNKVKSPVEFRGNTLRTSFLPQK